MKITIAGGTGFIGSRMVAHFLRQKAEITVISRSGKKRADAAVRHVTWEDVEKVPETLEEQDALINLSGETINQYWTASAKRRILDSRVATTRRIARLVDRLQNKPEVVLNGSAIGIYGQDEKRIFDESSPPARSDFLAEVGSRWEEESRHIRGARVVQLRIGIVLGRDGGVLPKMALPYRLGIGGRIGHGRQWMSWIHVTDLVRIAETCIRDKEIEGPVNCTAPLPVTQDGFGRTLAEVLNRPHYFPLPAPVLKLILGEMSSLLLEGQRVLPKKMLGHGFVFCFPTLRDALADLLKD